MAWPSMRFQYRRSADDAVHQRDEDRSPRTKRVGRGPRGGGERRSAALVGGVSRAAGRAGDALVARFGAGAVQVRAQFAGDARRRDGLPGAATAAWSVRGSLSLYGRGGRK